MTIRGRQNRHQTLLQMGFALLVSFGVLIIGSKNSFLYPMNDWVDVNCFFTVGRGITHGLVPYRDLYDQKGPLLYFVYALAALISEHSFLGVFVIEVLLFALFLYMGGRMAALLADKPCAFWLAVSGLGIGIPLSPAFSHGGSAEEFFLPVFAGTLYIVLKAMRERRPLTRGRSVVLGILGAAALWTKYTFCGLFVGLAVAVLIWYLADRMGKALPGTILWALIGAAAASAAVLGWYILNGSVGTLWQVYFVDNLTRYSQNIRSGSYPDPLPNLLNNLSWSIPAALGLAGLLIAAKKSWRELLAVVLSAAVLFAFTYASGRKYPYYAMVMACFAPMGFGMLLRMVSAAASATKAFRLGIVILAVLIAAVSPVATLHWSNNVYLMGVPKEEMPPYRFAGTIRQAEDQTLLNYGFLDGGYYLAANSQPVTRFFCTLNNDLPEMTEEHRTAIAEGRTAFVVTRGMGGSQRQRKGGGQNESPDMSAYRAVDTCTMVFEGREWTYTLYERIDERAGMN